MATVEPSDHQHSTIYLATSALAYATGAVTAAAEAAVDVVSVADVAESLHYCTPQTTALHVLVYPLLATVQMSPKTEH
jgi:hypothetical protein